MPSSKNYLDNIRNKSETTRNILAASLALLPAILVGYAQFYMNERHSEQKVAEQRAVKETTQKEAMSAVASIGKIFSEGKESVNEAFNNLKKIDDEMLKAAKIEDSTTDLQNQTPTSSTNTISVIDNSTDLKKIDN